MSSETPRAPQRKDWDGIHETWKENNRSAVNALELIRKDYRMGTKKRRIIQGLIEREESHGELMSEMIDAIQDMDRILHS